MASNSLPRNSNFPPKIIEITIESFLQFSLFFGGKFEFLGKACLTLECLKNKGSLE
jgi:hypothetical protein